MSAEEAVKSEPKKKTKKKILRRAAALAVFVIVLAVLALPWFVSSEKGRKMILARINSSIDGKMDFAGLTMGWWSGVMVTDIGFDDSAGRISVRVKQITTKPHYGSILTGGLSLGKTEVLEPRVEVNLARPQVQKPQRPKQEEKSRSAGLPIKRVEMIVKDGDLKVTDAKSETVELSQINSRLNLQGPREQTDFDVDMTVVDGGRESKIAANGRIVPGRGWRWEGTSGEVTVEVNDLELGSLSLLFAMGGIDVEAEGNISGNIAGEISNGQLEKMKAEINGKDLDVNTVKLTGGRIKTSQLGVNVKLARAKDMINIESFDIKSDWLAAEGHGVIPTTAGSLDEFLKTDSSLSGRFEVDMAQLSAQMPGVLKLKEGTNVTSGVLSGDIETLMEDGERKIKGQSNLEGLAGMVGGKAIALSQPVRVEAEITSEKDGVKFDKLDLSSAFAKVNCSGTTQAFRYHGDIDLARLQAELGQFVDTKGYGIAGELSGQGEVAVKEDKISAAGSSTVKNFRLSSAEGVSAFEPAAAIDFSAAVERKENILDVDFVKAKASLGEVNIKDTILPLGKENKGEMKLDVSAKDIDLQKAQPFAVLLADFPREMQLSGIAGGQAAVRSKNDKYFVTTEGIQIKNLRVNYPGKAPFEQREVSAVFDAEADSAEKTIIVKKFQIESDQIKVRGAFSKTNEGEKTKVESRAECEYDWAAVSTIAAPFLPAGLQMSGKRKDTITFNSQWPTNDPDKMLANMTGSAKLGFDSAEYMGLQIGATEMAVNIDKGKLMIPPFSATANNGTLNFGANADFSQKPTLLMITQPMNIVKDVQINDRVAAALLKNVNPIFANSRNAQGVANLECRELAIPLSGGTENDTRIDATISIMNLNLQSPLLQVLAIALKRDMSSGMALRPSQFVMRHGVLSYDKMQIDLGDMSLIFGGQMGPGNKMNITMTLPGLGGIALKGTKDKPEIDAIKMAQLILQQQLLSSGREGQPQAGQTQPQQELPVEELINKGLEELFKNKKK
ncbi:MAG: hypothetical protein PHQ35_07540 [Phycisphaerae bacterium]|nr:hypothetical protein [Phycisphaerae bacterium]MDD5380014.1 hypothetical protein [Phycisphaerae bacterium]